MKIWAGAGLALLLVACGEREENIPESPPTPDTQAAVPEQSAQADPAGPGPEPTAQSDPHPPGAAPIEGLPDELNSYGCFACHGMNEVRIGPPYRAIAMRYRGEPGAADALTHKVIEGGAGAWGPVPMISHRLSEEQVRPLVEAILAIK